MSQPIPNQIGLSPHLDQRVIDITTLHRFVLGNLLEQIII